MKFKLAFDEREDFSFCRNSHQSEMDRQRLAQLFFYSFTECFVDETFASGEKRRGIKNMNNYSLSTFPFQVGLFAKKNMHPSAYINHDKSRLQ